MGEITNELESSQALPTGAVKQIKLPSGKTATIFEGYGYHSQKAMELSNNNSAGYMNALMSLLIEIDGEKMRPDEFEKIKIADYLALQGEFAQANF